MIRGEILHQHATPAQWSVQVERDRPKASNKPTGASPSIRRETSANGVCEPTSGATLGSAATVTAPFGWRDAGVGYIHEEC